MKIIGKRLRVTTQEGTGQLYIEVDEGQDISSSGLAAIRLTVACMEYNDIEVAQQLVDCWNDTIEREESQMITGNITVQGGDGPDRTYSIGADSEKTMYERMAKYALEMAENSEEA